VSFELWAGGWGRGAGIRLSLWDVRAGGKENSHIRPKCLTKLCVKSTDSPTGLLLRFDVPPDDSIRAEVMILVKGPWKPTAKPKNRRGGGGDEQEAKGGVDEKKATE
jgi:hypothetical protein